MRKILGIIPARYASTRFPGKMLADIAGKSMVERVYRQTLKASCLSSVFVATDNELIFNHVRDFGGHVVMTSTDHPSGTDRCLEALKSIGSDFEYLINIQGDEPFIQPQQIDELAAMLDGQTEIATLGIKPASLEQLSDFSEVKIALDHSNKALYFSRSIIPYPARVPQQEWLTASDFLLHVGIYGYRVDVLEAICKLSPSSLEKIESLEQLRWLQNGFAIKVGQTIYESKCIETPEDLQKILEEIKLKNLI